jgi:hypothetical protein
MNSDKPILPKVDISIEDAEKLRTNATDILRRYEKTLGYLNSTGQTRVKELRESIRYAHNNDLLVIVSKFIKDGKTDNDRRFYRLFGTSSNLERTSLRGMFIDTFMPKNYFAGQPDDLRMLNLRRWTKDSDTIADLIKKNLRSIFQVKTVETKNPSLSRRPR